MVDQKQGAMGKDEKAGKPTAADQKQGAASTSTGERYRSEGGTGDGGHADEDGAGDRNLQADANHQRGDSERYHREVHRRGEADESRRKYLLSDDQGQARADGQEVTFSWAHRLMKGSCGSLSFF